MAAVCQVCGKHPSFGMAVSHSHRRTRRRWNPNIQRIRAVVNGTPKRLSVCTSCIKAGKVQKAVRSRPTAMMQEPWVSAVVTLAVPANDLASIMPVKGHFTSAGFEVHAPLGSSFGIAGPKSQFEKTFNVVLVVNDAEPGHHGHHRGR